MYVGLPIWSWKICHSLFKQDRQSLKQPRDRKLLFGWWRHLGSSGSKCWNVTPLQTLRRQSCHPRDRAVHLTSIHHTRPACSHEDEGLFASFLRNLFLGCCCYQQKSTGMYYVTNVLYWKLRASLCVVHGFCRLYISICFLLLKRFFFSLHKSEPY